MTDPFIVGELPAIIAKRYACIDVCNSTSAFVRVSLHSVCLLRTLATDICLCVYLNFNISTFRDRACTVYDCKR